MTTQWRWAAISPEINLTLTLDSDDPTLIEAVEYSAKSNGIVLTRIEDWPAPLPEADAADLEIPPDYWGVG